MVQIHSKISILILFVVISMNAFSQTSTNGTYLGIGFHFGYNITDVKFKPAIVSNKPDYESISGYSGGLIVNLMAESYAGIQFEANISNRGWKETLDSVYTYKRDMRYLEIPVLTHLSFGKRRFRYIFNLGPYIAFHRETAEQMEYLNPNLFNESNDTISTNGIPIDNELDLGFIVDAGFGVNTSIGIFQIKARYSQGILNIFDKYPESPYRYSQIRNIYFGVSYYYNFYFNKEE